MPEHLPTDLLREMHPGEQLSASVMNAIIRAAKMILAGETSLQDGGGIITRPSHLARVAWPVQAVVNEDVTGHALLGVYTNQDAGSGSGQDLPQTFAGQLGLYGSGASLLGLFTNGDVAVSSGQWLTLRPVNDYDPVRVEVTGEVPGVGEPCGPELDTWGISAHGSGFVCLSDPIEDFGGSGSGARTYVWVMRVPAPCMMLGRAMTDVSAGSGDLASGEIRVLFRGSGSGDNLIEAISPVTGERGWELPYWVNNGGVSSGQIIQVVSTLGVGFMLVRASGRNVIAKLTSDSNVAKGAVGTYQLWRVVHDGGVITGVEKVEGSSGTFLNLYDELTTSGMWLGLSECDGVFVAFAGECES